MERRGKCFSKITLILFILFFLWILLQFLAPIILPQGSIKDLSGLTIVSDNDKTIDNLDFPWNSIYSAGDRLCHQKADRSFFINGNQMPFCSRCTAIWLGIAIGLGIMIFYKINLDERFLIIFIISITPIALDGAGQLFGLWESNNITRVITGFIVGMACGVAFDVILSEVKQFRKKA